METYHGHVRTPADAIKLFEACRLGLLPRVQRRLSEKERQSISSGSVFVWDEREAGMRRWTDGKSWSASRVSGSFLTYREMEGKRGGGNFIPAPSRRMAGKTPDSGRGSDEDQDMEGEGPDGYRYKPDGLMKQSFSITTQSGQHLHLISYYARPHAGSQELMQPTQDPALRHIVPVKGMYPETVHEQAQGPAVTRTPMQSAYINSPQQMAPGPPPQVHGRGPYAYPASQGYSWPPSPVSTPPYSYGPVSYASQLPPPPGSAHQSPHYSPHHPLPPTSGPPHQAGPTAYDRIPPPLQDSSLPPHPNSRQSMSAPMSAPPYKPDPSPRMSSATLAQQQAQQAQRLHQQQQMQAPPIDPRLMGPAPTTPQQPQTNGHSPGSGTSARDQAPSTQANGTPNGQSQTIPSISALVHASNASEQPAAPAPPAPPADIKSSPAVSRNGSASPKDRVDGANGDSAPGDIPRTRMPGSFGGGEDIRALRVLDRKFMIS